MKKISKLCDQLRLLVALPILNTCINMHNKSYIYNISMLFPGFLGLPVVPKMPGKKLKPIYTKLGKLGVAANLRIKRIPKNMTTYHLILCPDGNHSTSN